MFENLTEKLDNVSENSREEASSTKKTSRQP